MGVLGVLWSARHACERGVGKRRWRFGRLGFPEILRLLKGVYCCTAASSIAIFSQITFFRSSSHNHLKCDGVAAWHIAGSTRHPQPPRVSLRSSMSTTRESVRRTSFAGAWTLARIKAAEGCGVVVVEAENHWRSRYFASDPRHRYPRPAIAAETSGLPLHARPSSSSRRGFRQFACP